MKNKLIIIISIFLLLSCRGVKKEVYTIEMKLIDGSTKTEKWILPKNSEFYIESHKGSYWLKYNSDYFMEHGTVKSAVIDYTVIEKQTYEK